jgi:formiminotetrahydrofolate cyclodeaminase
MGNPNLIGDALTGALLAEAACRAAANLVKINLVDAPADPRLEEAEELSERALAARLTALRVGAN